MSLVQKYIANRFCRSTSSYERTRSSSEWITPEVKKQDPPFSKLSVPSKKYSNLSHELLYLPASSEKGKIEAYNIGKNYRTFGGYTLKVIGKDHHTIEVLAHLAEETATMTHLTFLDIMNRHNEFEHRILYKIEEQIGA